MLLAIRRASSLSFAYHGIASEAASCRLLVQPRYGLGLYAEYLLGRFHFWPRVLVRLQCHQGRRSRAIIRPLEPADKLGAVVSP
jgi:hypothetical protein